MRFCEELFNWSFTFMKRVGYFDQHRRAWLLLIAPISLCLTAFYRTYVIRNDFDEVIVNLFKISSATVTTIRAFVVMHKAQAFLDFFVSVDRWFQELQCDSDEMTLKRTHEFVRKVNKASKALLIITTIILSYIILVQLLATVGIGYRKLIVDVAFPGIDLYESPYWEMVSILECLGIAPFTFFSYVSYLLLTLIAISFGIFLMKDLQCKFESMNDMTEQEALKCIKQCVKDHVLILKYHHDLEVLFSVGSFADVSFFGLIPCVIIVFVTMDHDMSLLIVDIQLSVMVMISTFIIFWVANIFCYESENIANAAYNCNWVDRNKEFRKYIPLIIGNSQKPLQLTAGGLKPINMEFFLTMLRCSYSLFTVLFTMKTEGDS
uniref:Odorant receptor n=1 Tax=Zeugodacus tau TaxID=137263 RepID=A0A6M9TZI2_ZEUTA|nr:odorant receptor [Zeugodacus tau]